MGFHLRRELSLSLRALTRSPGLAALAVLAIGLGTSLTTGVFALADAIFFRSPPYPNLPVLVTIERRSNDGENKSSRVAPADFVRWRDENTTLRGMFAYYQGTANLAAAGLPPERVSGAFTTPTFLQVLGLEVALGRPFNVADGKPGAPPVTLISDHLWQSRFRSDPRALGRTLRVNGHEHTIVGVLPPGLQPPSREDIWVPLRNDGQYDAWHPRMELSLMVVARMKPGVTVDEVMADLRRLDPPTTEDAPATQAQVWPMGSSGRIREASAFLLAVAMVVLVFVISVANAANLQLARYCERAREVAIRAALGASRRQLARGLLLESLLIGLLGGLLGLLLALWYIELIRIGAARLDNPFWFDVALDPRAFTFTFVVSLGAGLIAGLLPTWRVTALDLNPILKDGGRNLTGLRQGRFSRGLAVLQLALTCTVLVLTGLTMRAVQQLDQTDLGFTPEEVLTSRVALFAADYPEVVDRQQFIQRLTAALSNRAGVTAASATSWLAGSARPTIEIPLPKRSRQTAKASLDHIGPMYFESFGRSLLAGRDFTPEDLDREAKVLIINESLARELYGRQNPLGQRINLNSPEPGMGDAIFEVIGVAPDLGLSFGPRTKGKEPSLYLHLGLYDRTFVTVTMHSPLPRETAQRLLRAEVQKLDPNLPLYFTRTVREAMTGSTWELRLWSATFQLFGAAAMLLSSIGLYGLMANAVRQRRQEISVRLAMGASRREVIHLVLGRAVWQLALALGLGFLLATFFALRLDGVLGGSQPFDATVFGSTLAFLVTVALLACALPLRRALRSNPFQSLRWE